MSSLAKTGCIVAGLWVAVAASGQSPDRIPTWPEEIEKGYLPYHQLTVKDFPIDDSAHPNSGYWVQPFIHYYYNGIAKMARGGMIYVHVTNWTVFSGFDKNLSSRKSGFHEMEAELPYAQAILDISELHARRMAALLPGEFPSGALDSKRD